MQSINTAKKTDPNKFMSISENGIFSTIMSKLQQERSKNLNNALSRMSTYNSNA